MRKLWNGASAARDGQCPEHQSTVDKSPGPAVLLQTDRVAQPRAPLHLRRLLRLSVAQVLQLLELGRREDPLRLDALLVSGKDLLHNLRGQVH